MRFLSRSEFICELGAPKEWVGWELKIFYWHYCFTKAFSHFNAIKTLFVLPELQKNWRRWKIQRRIHLLLQPWTNRRARRCRRVVCFPPKFPPKSRSLRLGFAKLLCQWPNDPVSLRLGLASTDANYFTTILRIAKVTLLSLIARGNGSLRGHNTN